MPLELDACPFCGSKNVKFAAFLCAYRIECADCGALGPNSKNDREMAALYWKAASNNLEWTRTRPTKPGFYFYRSRRGTVSVVQLIPYVALYSFGKEDHGLLCNGLDHACMKGSWAGPIQTPPGI